MGRVLRRIAHALEKITDADERVTLIAPDGTVIADTEANADLMENHLERSEVKQAVENGSGKSVRYSDTLTEKIIYYALKMPDGNILRVSVKHYERVNLRELSEDVVKRLGFAAENKSVAVSVIGNAEITGVRKILDEMIFNLCDNAVKYNKNGGSADIIISSDTEKHIVTLTVRDTGIGIPGYAQSRVFERFYRVDKGRSKSAGGTGSGTCYRKARRYLS